MKRSSLLLAIGLLVLGAAAYAAEPLPSMFYQAKLPETGRTWDTWLYWNEGIYYLYYLANCGKKWDNISMATSNDGVHWKELGRVLTKADGVTWMGTGSTWRSPNFAKDKKFFLNFSEWRGPRQTIFFAESSDLLHWTRLPGNLEFKQDERWYERNGRWDCIYTIAREGGGLLGYWTATPKRETGGRFGFGQSLDGVRWQALPPPKVEGAGDGEVGAVERLGSRYYMMFGTGGKMVTLVADRPEGPFRAAKKNFLLLGGQTYFSRFFPTPDGVLISHHSMCPQGIFMAPLKRATVDGEGTLRLTWWQGNDKLKHEAVEVSPPRAGPAGASPILMLDKTLPVRDGLVLELSLPRGSAKDGTVPGGSYGLYVEHGDHSGSAILLRAGGASEIGPMRADGSGFKCNERTNREMAFGPKVRCRLLLKQSLLEFYVDDVLMHCRGLSAPATGRIGLIGADAATDLKAWR